MTFVLHSTRFLDIDPMNHIDLLLAFSVQLRDHIKYETLAVVVFIKILYFFRTINYPIKMMTSHLEYLHPCFTKAQTLKDILNIIFFGTVILHE